MLSSALTHSVGILFNLVFLQLLEVPVLMVQSLVHDGMTSIDVMDHQRVNVCACV